MVILKYTSAEWGTFNYVLQDGQLGVESDSDKLKIGNGSTPWILLPYIEFNGMSAEQSAALIKVTQPTTGTLIGGSNGIDLTNAYGKLYNTYNMASGALTLVPAASPVNMGNASVIIVGNNVLTPDLSAFTKHPKSDDFDVTDNNRNLIEFKVISGINFYNITCLDV